MQVSQIIAEKKKDVRDILTLRLVEQDIYYLNN